MGKDFICTNKPTEYFIQEETWLESDTKWNKMACGKKKTADQLVNVSDDLIDWHNNDHNCGLFSKSNLPFHHLMSVYLTFQQTQVLSLHPILLTVDVESLRFQTKQFRCRTMSFSHTPFAVGFSWLDAQGEIAPTVKLCCLNTQKVLHNPKNNKAKLESFA